MPDLRRDLARVRWLGGSTCAGKTSIAQLLAAEHGLRLYACDDAFDDHRRRARPDRHAGFRRLMDLSAAELALRPMDQQVEDLTAFYRDQMDMIVEDLLALSANGPVLAEGTGLLPELVAPLLTARRRAVWLIATPELRRRLYPQRSPWLQEMLAGMEEPGEVFDRWMARDDEMARQRAGQAAALGLAVVAVDGKLSIAETADTVARGLGLRNEA